MFNTEFQQVVIGVYPKYAELISDRPYDSFNYNIVQFLHITETEVAKMMRVDSFHWISRFSFSVKIDGISTFSFYSDRYNRAYLNDCLLEHMHIDQDMIDFVLKL